MAKLEVSDIARSIKGRIREVEEQLKDRRALSDELERLKGALSRLEGGERSRVDAGAVASGRSRSARRRQRQRTPPAPSTNTRATRGENKTKILASLKDGPKTASEIATETSIKASTISASLSKLAKTGEVVKADRGYALPK